MGDVGWGAGVCRKLPVKILETLKNVLAGADSSINIFKSFSDPLLN